MPAQLITRAADGTEIINSSTLVMGLVKSGYLSYAGTRQRWGRSALNNDNMYAMNVFDPVYAFTVKATAPLVYVYGTCIFLNSSRQGDLVTFYFALASSSVRFYCFDLMADRGPGAKLRLYKDSAINTFDSSQVPLKIKGTVSPPGPPNYSGNYGGWGTVGYSGGSRGSYGIGNNATAYSTWSAGVGSGNYAANLPWRRSLSHTDPGSYTYSIGALEGCYGGGGVITFIMGTEAGCSLNGFFQGYFSGSPPIFFAIPTDRMPTATYIDIADYPFPYDIA